MASYPTQESLTSEPEFLTAMYVCMFHFILCPPSQATRNLTIPWGSLEGVRPSGKVAACMKGLYN